MGRSNGMMVVLIYMYAKQRIKKDRKKEVKENRRGC